MSLALLLPIQRFLAIKTILWGALKLFSRFQKAQFHNRLIFLPEADMIIMLLFSSLSSLVCKVRASLNNIKEQREKAFSKRECILNKGVFLADAHFVRYEAFEAKLCHINLLASLL